MLKINQDSSPITAVKIQKKLIINSERRDTSLRSKFFAGIKSDLEKQLCPADSQKLLDIISKYDVGHVVELEHGGSNEFSNLVLESKIENREPGLKRQIERKNQAMLSVGKQVMVTNQISFDNRLPIPVPCNWNLTQEIRHKNGLQYRVFNYEMSSEPYLEIATNFASRSLLVKTDVKRGLEEVSAHFVKSALIKASSSKEECVKARIKNAILTGFKVCSPYIAKTVIKVGMACAQTSDFFSQEIKNGIAKKNISKNFNAILNNSVRLASSFIFMTELK